jgi:ribosomal-protein-alanine N-acetyltransferase
MLNLNFSPFPVLVTERLVLRALKIADGRAIHILRSDDRVNRYLERPKSITLSEAKNFIRHINGGIARNKWIYWGITLKNEDALAGTVCLWNFSEEQRSAEVGFELHPDHQGKGIMREALVKVMEFGFRELRLHAIQAFTNVKNERSIHLLEKCNFERKARKERQIPSGEVMFCRTNTEEL